MKCTICDICKNPIDTDEMYCIRKNKRKFRVFEKYEAYDGLSIVPMTNNIDLCSLCYQELIKAVKERIGNNDI